MEIVAISVDANEESRKLCASQGYTFPFLSDPKADVIRRYGVVHPRAGEDGQDIARPAEFLVDAAGNIRWANLTDDLKVRARPENVLKEIDELPRARASLTSECSACFQRHAARGSEEGNERGGRESYRAQLERRLGQSL